MPQRRRRAIVIGVRDGDVPWPTQTHADPASRCRSGGVPWRTFRDAVRGLPLKPTGEDWHVGRNPRPETIVRYKDVPHDGGNRFQMQDNLDAAGLGDLVPPCWRNKPTGTTDVFGRLWWDRPAFTIRTEFYKPEKGRYLHPSEHRPITIREAARCMSFPDDFVLPGRPEVDGGREADRQRRAARCSPRRSPGRSRTRWTSPPIRCAGVPREPLTLNHSSERRLREGSRQPSGWVVSMTIGAGPSDSRVMTAEATY